MKTSIIFSKTAKGLAELRTRQNNLPKGQIKALNLVDGHSTIAELAADLDALRQQGFLEALVELEKLGLIRIFQGSVQGTGSTSEPHSSHRAFAVDDSLDHGDSPPTLEVTELSPEDSVRVWAEAQRGAQELAKEGFYANANKRIQGDVLPAGNSTDTPTVLVVEDDESIGELLEAHLIHKGFRVIGARSIPEAMSALRREPVPDLALLDLVLPGLPGMDGFYILGQIRRSPVLKGMPAIIITTQVSDEQVMRGLKEGADGYIFKPFKWETVYACIQSVIRIQGN
jgi:CheY-like chemotaxis protein